jgi:hypothetical protein
MTNAGRYRRLFPRIWRHPGFRHLPETSQRLALYVLAGPQTNRCGLFCFSMATAAEDLGVSVHALRKRLAEVQATFDWCFDPDARVLYIPSWWRWNPPENMNVLLGALKDLGDVPPCRLVAAFAENIETLPPTFHQTFRERCPQRLPERSANSTVHGSTEHYLLSPPDAGTAEDDRKKAENGTKTENAENAENGEIAVFLRRFCALYAQYRHGAKYFIARAKHVPLIRALLAEYGRERLERLTMVLLNTDDEWIQTTDRGIGILSVKASWLEERLASYEAKQGPIQAAS